MQSGHAGLAAGGLDLPPSQSRPGQAPMKLLPAMLSNNYYLLFLSCAYLWKQMMFLFENGALKHTSLLTSI